MPNASGFKDLDACLKSDSFESVSFTTFSLAANKIGWPINAVDCLAFHAKPVETLPAKLSEGGKAIILLREFRQIEQILSILKEHNVNVKESFMLSRLGCQEEKVVKLTDSKLSDFRQASKSLKPLALGITYKMLANWLLQRLNQKVNHGLHHLALMKYSVININWL